MFKQSFSIAGSTLELLKAGERGVVVSCKSQDEYLVRKLIAMGVTPGTPITLEQRFPSFVIKAGHSRFAIDKQVARSIYVRVTK
jgi:ferrous iron transport protein A